MGSEAMPDAATLPMSDLDRRELLVLAALLGAAGLLPPPLAAQDVGRAAQRIGLDEFMALSRMLTGSEDLSRDLGDIYLRSLEADPNDAAELMRLWSDAGFQGTMPSKAVREPIEASVFAREDLAEAAKAILKLWYTGIYRTADGPKVAEYTDTLAWRAVGYTAAPSNCGGETGFWADPPAAQDAAAPKR